MRTPFPGSSHASPACHTFDLVVKSIGFHSNTALRCIAEVGGNMREGIDVRCNDRRKRELIESTARNLRD